MNRRTRRKYARSKKAALRDAGFRAGVISVVAIAGVVAAFVVGRIAFGG